jgi:hypothetical protein
MDDIWTMTVRIPREAVADRPMVRHALSVLFGPGEWHELRALPSGRGQIVQVDDLDAACSAVESVADQQVYYSLNPIAPGSDRASKKTVLARRWLLIDVDAVKPKDVSSTEEEKVKAATVAGAVLEYLLSQGWPAPIMIDSGNGWHLLYRIDLPNDVLSQQILKSLLYALGERFTSDQGVIDRSTHDAPRISKLPGTMARKGPDTPERPHRLCRIVYEPDVLEVVPVELIQKIGTPPEEKPAATNGKYDPWTSVVSNGPGLTAYLKRAIESECLKVALAVADRNNQLNKSAFALGQFAGWPEMNEREAKATLQLAAERAGLLDREIIKTIASGWEAGTKEPRVRPQEPVKQADKPTLDPNASPIIWGNKIKRRKVEWLWPARIPFGKQTTFAGQTGMGKTFAVCDLAARITRGMEIPFQKGLCFEQGTVLIVSAEDDADDTLLPRFYELGGDPSKLAFLSPEAEDQFSLAALDLLNRSIDAMGKDVKMVAIDPPTSYLGRTDDHKNAELRGLLTPLKRWARDRKIALVFVTHVNKAIGQKVDAMARVIGSAAWVQAVRAAHMFCPNPDVLGKNLFVTLKVNNAEKGKALSYVIEPLPNGEAVLKWIEEVDVTADEAMGNVKRKSAGVNAVEWLADRFREKTEWESAELKRLGAECGLTGHALFKSPEVNALPINKRPRINSTGDRYWVWIAQPGWPAARGAESSESSESTIGTPY